MNINIRQHIINNFKDDSTEVLRNSIEESIKEKDELTLPGMGVLLEIIWQGADMNLKNQMLEIIEKQIKKIG